MRNLRKPGPLSKIISIILILLFVFISCQNKKNTTSSEPEKEILNQLQAIKGKGILFGHQDDLAYGMGWNYVEGESDVKLVAGDYPALFGWELGGIEEDHQVNLDSVPFSYMRKLAVWGHQSGGINTFSWHPFSAVNGENSWNTETIVVKNILPDGSHHSEFLVHLDRLGNFFQSLKDDDGETVPFIFRPWHEMDGSWFWWGSKSCTHDEFKELFRFTVEYLRSEKGLDQMAVAYSPDRNFNTIEEYKTWYPGDDVVDILGMDDYHDFNLPNGKDLMVSKLHLIFEFSKTNNKPVAFTETGLENVTDSTWFSQKLGAVLNDPIVKKELSYVMVWRSDPRVHFFFPYPGHPSASDAKKLLDQPNILLLEDFKTLISELVD